MKILEEYKQNQTLNPVLFAGMKMKPEIREKLLDIVNEFSSQVDDEVNFKILDVVLVGSQAGYNYTPFSDIDLHIVTNFARISYCNPEVVQCLFNSEKARFNKNYDITVKGINVEIYVEDVKSSTRSNGIYSILRDGWVKVPKLPETNEVQINDIANSKEFQAALNLVNETLASGSASEISDCIDQLYIVRKEGLESDEGEQSEGNLIFKELRNRGLLDKLKARYYETRSQDLSLEGLMISED